VTRPEHPKTSHLQVGSARLPHQRSGNHWAWIRAIWHRRVPPATRIVIPDSDPAGEVVALRSMVERLEEIVQTLTTQVRGLRDELAALQVEPPPSILDARPPDPPVPPGNGSTNAGSLTIKFDRLHELADALWFETQWLRAELAVAQENSNIRRTG